MGRRLKSETDLALDRLALTVLRRLCEPGAVLGMAPGGSVAVVARRSIVYRQDAPPAPEVRSICRFDAASALAFIARGWIARRAGGSRALRYGITPEGRATLDRLIAARQAERAAPPAPLADRLGALRRHDGGPLLWPHEIAFAVDWAAGAAMVPGDAGRILSDLAAERGPVVARIARAVLISGLPLRSVARREGVTPAAARRLTATAVRCLGAGLV